MTNRSRGPPKKEKPPSFRAGGQENHLAIAMTHENFHCSRFMACPQANLTSIYRN